MSKKLKKASSLQEKATAALFEGKQVIASGALWFSKGDVVTDTFLIENKMTSKDFYSLKISTWNKIKKEAIKAGLRTPLMVIMLGSGKSFVVFDFFECKGKEVFFIEIDKGSYRITESLLNEIIEEEIILALNFKQTVNTTLFVMKQEDFLQFLKEKEVLLN